MGLQKVIAMSLTALKVVRPSGRYADMRGLDLLVRDGGLRFSMLRMQRDGQRRDFGLGAVRDVSV